MSGGAVKVFFSYYTPHWRLLLLDLLMAIFAVAAELLFPYATRYALNRLLPNGLYKAFFLLMAGLLAAYLVRGLAQYIVTVLIYLAVANLIGLCGFKPPTKDLNVTAALAIMSMCLIEFSGIRKNGFKHWAAHFAKPVPFVAPIMVLEIVIRPLSLCMRLFGNVLGAFVIMELLKAVAPVLIPIPFSFYFDIFDGFLQAYVFVFLTALFMNEEQE